MVTCVLPSGRNHHNSPLLRTSVSLPGGRVGRVQDSHTEDCVILLMAEILHQLRLVVYPIIYRALYIPGGVQPSTVGFLRLPGGDSPNLP